MDKKTFEQLIRHALHSGDQDIIEQLIAAYNSLYNAHHNSPEEMNINSNRPYYIT